MGALISSILALSSDGKRKVFLIVAPMAWRCQAAANIRRENSKIRLLPDQRLNNLARCWEGEAPAEPRDNV
jgi:hypothetical protein